MLHRATVLSLRVKTLLNTVDVIIGLRIKI